MSEAKIVEIKRKSIKQIEASLFAANTPDKEELERWRQDERKGVQSLLRKYDRKQEQKAVLVAKHDRMNQYEKEVYQQGYHYIAGIDEVGRGPLAGPVIAAAVVLPQSFQLLGLTDSK